LAPQVLKTVLREATEKILVRTHLKNLLWAGKIRLDVRQGVFSQLRADFSDVFWPGFSL